jgi:hypothetical protein
MPLIAPPEGFVRRLASFDPLLRLRWSDSKGQYLLERKVTRGKEPDPACYADWDQYVAAREGYTWVMSLGLGELDDRVFWTLWANDIQRFGGGDKLADIMDLNDERRKQQVRDGWLGECYDQAKDWYRWATTMSPTKTWADVTL